MFIVAVVVVVMEDEVGMKNGCGRNENKSGIISVSASTLYSLHDVNKFVGGFWCFSRNWRIMICIK